MRGMWRRIVLLSSLAVLVFAGMLIGGTVTESYLDATASITAPDATPPGLDFPVELNGKLQGAGPFGTFAYSVRLDATWSYDANHMVSWSVPGSLIDASGFEFGEAFNQIYLLNLPEGSYKVTFMMGWRTSGHSWYDVAADVFVTVGEEASGTDEDEDVDEVPDTDEDEDPDPNGGPV